MGTILIRTKQHLLMEKPAHSGTYNESIKTKSRPLWKQDGHNWSAYMRYIYHAKETQMMLRDRSMLHFSSENIILEDSALSD